MVNFPGRNGRRRRVLNDEVLSASNSHAAQRSIGGEYAGPTAPRYSEAAGMENHPQITDFVPRRYRTIVLLVLFGLVSTAALSALHYIAPTIAPVAGGSGASAFDFASRGSVVSWVAAVVLLLASALCLLIYSIRRHRIDDYRGRYRVWLAAAVACLFLSANSVAGLHHLPTASLSYFTGWSALRNGAAWWLVLAGVPMSWIAIRTLMDVKECRLAAALLVAAGCYYVAAGAGYLGFITVSGARIDTMLHAAATLVGHWLVLAAVASYARFVVLDAQGLVPIRQTSAKRREKKAGPAQNPKPAAAPSSVLAAGGYTRQKPLQIKPVDSPASAKDWVDGSRPERETFEDDGGDDSPGETRKLSKADRKRLRKLKAQNRAA